MEIWGFLIAKVNGSFPLMDTAHPHREWPVEKERDIRVLEVLWNWLCLLDPSVLFPSPVLGFCRLPVFTEQMLYGVQTRSVRICLHPPKSRLRFLPPGNQISLVPPGSNNTIPVQTDGWERKFPFLPVIVILTAPERAHELPEALRPWWNWHQ